MPSPQWTKTLPPLERAASMNSLALWPSMCQRLALTSGGRFTWGGW